MEMLISLFVEEYISLNMFHQHQQTNTSECSSGSQAQNAVLE